MSQDFDYIAHFENKLNEVRKEGRYRSFANLERIAGRFPKAIYRPENGVEKEVTIWCSNDYLGMGQHPVVLNAAQEALENSGAGAGGDAQYLWYHPLSCSA